MKKIVLWSVRILLVTAMIVFIDVYQFHGSFAGKYIGLGESRERDLYIIKQADMLSSAGKNDQARSMYKDVISKTDDDLAYERALRAYSTNLEQSGEVQKAIMQELQLASNPRVRATARAGAIEKLAEAYLHGTSLSVEELNEIIFTQAPFNELLTYKEENEPEYVTLLEYANTISLRPLVTAMLAEYYGRQVYAGDQEALTSLENTLALLPSLLEEMSETNLKRPLVYTYHASALLYISAAGLRLDGHSPVVIASDGLDVSEYIYNFTSSILESNQAQDTSPELLLSQPFAPDAQFTILFKTLKQIPSVVEGPSVLQLYDQYVANGYAMTDNTQEFASELKSKYSDDSFSANISN